MIETIDAKYLKQRRENGDVYIRWGTWVDKHEKRVVKESVPVIGKIFPFIKRKKTVDVVVGMEGPFINETDVSKFDFSNPAHQNLLKNVPYSKIVELDEKLYGNGLYLAFVADKTGEKVWDGEFHIVTSEGVIIGKFNDENVIGYYNPGMHHLLPREYTGNPENFGLEEIVAAYCAKNPEAKEAIPEETKEKFPEMTDKVDEAIKENQSKKPTLSLSDGGRA